MHGRSEPETLRPETKESRQEHKRKSETNGNLSTFTRSKESDIKRERKDNAQVETLVVSATIPVNVEQVPVLPLPPKLETKSDEKFPSKGKPPRGVHLGRGSRSRAKITSKELAQIHRVIRGTLPCVKITNDQQAASLARSVRSFTRRRTDSRRRHTRVEEKGQWPSFGM